MISSSLKRWQQSRSYRIDGDTVYGVASGVGFAVSEEDGGKLVILMLSGGDSAFDAMEDKLLDSDSELNKVQVGDVESYLALFFDESEGRMPDVLLDELLAFVALNYRSCGFRVPNKCVVCGEPATKRSFRDGMVQPMCASCREKEKNQKRTPVASTTSFIAEPDGGSDYDEYSDRAMQEEVHRRTAEKFADVNSEFGAPEKPMRNIAFDPQDDYDEDYRDPGYVEGSAGAGVLGALLGSVAGLVFFAVFSLVLHLSLSVLNAFCAIFAVLGYIAFGGIRKKSTSLGSVIFFSMFVSVIGVLLSQIYSKAASYGSFAAGMPYLFETPIEIIVIMVINILAVLLGVALMTDKLGSYLEGGK